MDEQLKSLIIAPEDNDNPIDFKEYLRVVDRFKWRIILFTTLIAILSVLYAYSLTPQYSSTVTLMIEVEQANVTNVEQIYDLDYKNRDYYMTQFAILKSRTLAEKVIKKLDLLNKADYNQLSAKFSENSEEANLDSSPSFQNALTSKQGINKIIMQNALSIFANKLTFQPIKNTKLVNITYDSADPELAAEVVNTLAELYIQSYLDTNLEKTTEVTTWMNERLTNLKNKLDSAQTNLQEYTEREKLVDVRGISSLAQKELDDLTSKHSVARDLLSQLKNIFELSNANGVTLDELVSLPEILNHSLIQTVKSTEIEAAQKVNNLAKRYGPKHPKMIAAHAELNSVQSSFESEVRKRVSSIATEYQSAKTNERDLSSQIAKAKSEIQRLAVIEREFANLQGEVDINQQLYTTIFKRLKETSETGGYQTANARILDRAEVALWPSKPSKSKIVALATLGSLMFGVLLAFFIDFLNSGIRSLDDIERRLGQRMLGLIPIQELAKNETITTKSFFNKDNPLFSEAFRTIRTSLLMSRLEENNKIILVTSAIPGEGKSTTATNLAIALGQMEKVLLIDADLRRPSLGKLFGYPTFQPGLSNLIAKSASLSSCIVTDMQTNIDLMPAGAIPPNPQELLYSDLMKTALKLLSAKYDRIIIDTAPTQAVADALILSTYADSLVYVIKSNSTHFKVVKSGLGRLLQIGANVAGVVLNQVNLEESTKYGDYGGYYDQYGYGPDDETVKESEKDYSDKLDDNTDAASNITELHKGSKSKGSKNKGSKSKGSKSKASKNKVSKTKGSKKKVLTEEKMDKGNITNVSSVDKAIGIQGRAALDDYDSDKKVQPMSDVDENLVAPPTFK